ncbi:MAG: hypothetical protein IT167_02885 [Bryobacterales bacterium]|nr:hypothetical protein [Bryobacterales bacterium]
MDLKSYYHQIRERAAELSGDFLVVASLATPDGGKAGVLTEVTRQQAAKLIVERRARPATEEETTEFLQEKKERHTAAEEQAAASKLHLTVVSDKTFRMLESNAPPSNKKTEG